MGHTVALDVSALSSSGTATFRQFSNGVNDVGIGPGIVNSGQLNFELPALSIVQAILPLSSTPPPVGEAHINDIAVSYQHQGKSYRATATVTIGDANGSPVEGATVHGVFSGLTSDSVSGMTNGNGQVILNSSNSRRGGTWTFCVNDVVRAGWFYNRSVNVETCDGITTP